jgi:hypothetical protein
MSPLLETAPVAPYSLLLTGNELLPPKRKKIFTPKIRIAPLSAVCFENYIVKLAVPYP